MKTGVSQGIRERPMVVARGLECDRASMPQRLQRLDQFLAREPDVERAGEVGAQLLVVSERGLAAAEAEYKGRRDAAPASVPRCRSNTC